ncbi:hypothetical protein ACQ4PT_030306 [Festuca glaucescens]
MATTSFPSVLFYFCMFLLCHGSMAQLFGQSFTLWQSSRQGGSRGCKFDRLQAFEPLHQVRSEAGITEYFDEQNEQFCCTGVSVIRRVIEPQGLLLPQYHNAHALVYILQGKGVIGLNFPGCPATFQQQFQPFGQGQFAQGQSRSQKFTDEHQRVHPFKQGDVVALPAGIVHWSYNDGDAPIVAIYVFDVNNNANQLEPIQKEFLLAGNNKRGQQFGQNIFSAFSVQLLSEALGISQQAAQRIRNQNDQRGEIIHVRQGLQFLKPIVSQQGQVEQQAYQPIQHREGQTTQYPEGQSTQYPGQSTQYPEGQSTQYPGQSTKYPEGQSTQYPQGQSTQYPGQSTQYPEGQSTQYPQGQSTQYPEGQSTQYPQGQSTQYPEGQSTQYPQGQSTQYPGQSTQYPEGQSTQYPQGQSTQYPKGQSTQYPQGQSTQYPQGQSTQYPVGQSTQYPQGQSTQYPGQSTQYPEVQSTQYPQGKSTQYPEGQSTQYPQGQSTQYPGQSTQYPEVQSTQYPEGQSTQYPGQSTQYPKGHSTVKSFNGLEENVCSLKATLNVESPQSADTYNPRAGRITRVSGNNFPILNIVQMSATRVNLYQNAILSPFWNINAHSVVYMIQGHARVQVVNSHGQTVFNDRLRQGQLLIIPQHFVVLKKAEREGCQYISFTTNANSMVSHIAGKNSILSGLPVDVLANAYRISRQEARNLKNNRGEEFGAFTPKGVSSQVSGEEYEVWGRRLIDM